MSLRPDPTDPTDMSAEQRMDEMASILARGILRLHRRALPDTPLTENLPESSPTCLELPTLPRPDGVAGYRSAGRAALHPGGFPLDHASSRMSGHVMQ